MFKVMESPCETCIYRKDSPLNLKSLEDQVRDRHIGFKGWRVCHHSEDACCRGFWNAHKDEFQVGQIAQRLGIVQFVGGIAQLEERCSLKAKVDSSRLSSPANQYEN